MKQEKQSKQLIRILTGALALVLVLSVAGCAFSGAASGPGATPSGAETGAVSATTITNNIEASGNVRAAQDASLVWKTNGIVDQVLVQAGDLVKAGDELANLELTSVPASVLAAQADLINAEQALEDLSPTALAISQAEQNIAQALDNVEAKQRIVDGLGTPANESDIEQANATVLLSKIQLDKAWDRYKPYQNRPDNNIIKATFYNRWAEAKQQYDQAVRRLNNLKGVTTNPTDKELAQANLALAQAQLADARQQLEDLKLGADARDVAAAQARITAAQATLSALSLTAPFDGEVLSVEVLPGDLVTTGQIAFSLANRQALHVDTLIDESEIFNVQTGDLAEITVDALPGVKLTGLVAFINPMGQTVSGNVKYPVRIDLDSVEQPVPLGATADVTIQTGSPRQVLLVPVRAIQTDNDGEFVIVFGEDGSQQRVDVTSGSLQGDQVIILNGDLQAGDLVLLPDAANEMLDRMQDMQQ